jgi:16S rRNA (uracil1498-N3)-methyltransferase
MSRYDFRTPRLYLDHDLAAGGSIVPVLVFNGRQGEWRAALADSGKRALALAIETLLREQTRPLDLHYWFAPLKHARLDYMVQKAVEMGVSRLQPVLMQHGQITRINLERMRGNAIEAAEQCGILNVPETGEPLALDRLIAARDPARLLVFCDEDAEVKDPLTALAAARSGAGLPPLAVLIGPEGGFAPGEREAMVRLPNVVRLSLGPRILRADTAAVAALAVVQSVLGDWR